jgi:hypothetical protein
MPNRPLDVKQEAYSREVSSAGFWPGSSDFPFPALYAYAYPSHDDFGKQAVEPKESFYSKDMGEFFLKYEDVQQSEDPVVCYCLFCRQPKRRQPIPPNGTGCISRVHQNSK